MVQPGNINNLKKGISEAEFNQILNDSTLKADIKEKILSIFTKISQNDGELSVDDWDAFIKDTDRNNNGILTNSELQNATTRESSIAFKLNRDALGKFYNLVRNYISNMFKAKQCNEDVVYINYSNPNPRRFHGKGDFGHGTFDGNWIARDKHDSKTFDEWLKNNDYEIDTETAENLYKAVTRQYNPKSNCARAVRQGLQDTVSQSYNALLREADEEEEDLLIENEEAIKIDPEKGKKNLFNAMERQKSAFKYASELANNPYFKELPHNIVVNMDLKSLPKGCIAVYDANYAASGSHPFGHIAVLEGDGEGFEVYGKNKRTKMATTKQDTHIRIFVPIKLSAVYKIDE